jgi:transposase-like protein
MARQGIAAMTDVFAAAHFRDDAAARKLIEGIRWPEGPVCPYCGTFNHAYPIKKAGWFRCAEKECRKDFTVTIGTVMERSHIPLHKWVIGFYLMNASKKGISAHQLHRTLGIRYQSAWFMCHRIREAMRAGGLAPMGGGGTVVESDETFIGRKKGVPMPKAGFAHKNVVLTLVERGGKARSFHVDSTRWKDVAPIIDKNLASEAKLVTDEASHYREIGRNFASHDTVNHSMDEYVRYERDADGDEFVIHTNTVEGYYSVFKRGMKGTYQHCSEKHLHRYLAEFDHRYNHRIALGYNDTDRTVAAIKGAEGKRLTYRQPH